MLISPPDETGLLHTGAAHGPLAQGGAVGDGPEGLPGHVRPLRGGEHRPGVTSSDQPLNIPHLLARGRGCWLWQTLDQRQGKCGQLKYRILFVCQTKTIYAELH